MDYRYDTEHIKALDRIRRDYDVRHVAHAFYPGLHCPLFAAVAMAMQIEDLHILVVGTEECAYYAKSLSLRADKERNRLYSFVLDKNDIAFGCGDKLIGAIKKIYREDECRVLLVISTCVVELIGEDFEAIIGDAQQELGLKILLARTNHYDQDSPVEGIKATLLALTKLMDRQTIKHKSVNILGHRFENFESTELGRLLDENGVGINVRIPTECDSATIKKAPAAQLNIVTNFAALDLAEKMKETFGTDYVYFEKYTDPDRIKKCYSALQDAMDIDISDFVEDMYSATVGQIDDIKDVVKDKTFVYGMPPMFGYEISSFLCKLGMKPLWIQTLGLRGDEVEFKDEILKYANPKVFRALDVPFMQKIIEREQPDYSFVGMGRFKKEGNHKIIELMKDINGIGFEVPINLMYRLKQAENKKDNKK